MSLRAFRIFLAFGAAVAVAGCGVRGNLELPPEQKAQQAQNDKRGPDGKPEHKGFILDGLLR